MAESLFIAVMLLAGFVLLVAMNAQGKARAFEDGDANVPGQRPPDAVTDVELPSPQFNRRDPETRRGK